MEKLGMMNDTIDEIFEVVKNYERLKEENREETAYKYLRAGIESSLKEFQMKIQRGMEVFLL